MDVRCMSRDEAEAAMDDVARLRIAVFRAYPYLYDGDEAYERRYLSTYLRAPDAVIIGAFDDGRLVGAATASPLDDHHGAFAAPFAARGIDPARIFYFGESVLLPEYRGRGAGVRFFEEREAAARRKGFDNCVFSAVVRRADHPMRPADYMPLDGFWTRRGYARLDGVRTTFSWRDLGETSESEKPMEFWWRRLEH